MHSQKRAFTLIELLIVVAIIAILAAIAVPNFLEAQTRAKVSRVKNDERALATALESYHIDNNEYAPNMPNSFAEGLGFLSSPISYITEAIYEDPFGNSEWNTYTNTGKVSIYFYFNYDAYGKTAAGQGTLAALPWWIHAQDSAKWHLSSGGPSRIFKYQICLDNGSGADTCGMWFTGAMVKGVNWYDPTNGTVSFGIIQRTQYGEMSGISMDPGVADAFVYPY